MTMLDSQMKKTARDAVKSAMDVDRKKREAEELKQKKKMRFEEFLHKKKVKRQWKDLQDQMLKTLSEKLHTWKFKGTWEARRDLYEILEASEAALKAQYFMSTQGLDPEQGAQKAAEKAIATLGKFADQATKSLMAKKAADMYIKQDGERKKAIAMIDRAITMLGPQEKARPNPYLTQCVTRVRDLIIQSASTGKVEP